MAQSYIYIIGPENGPYKIGYSSKPEERCRQLQTGQPQHIKVHHLREIDEERVAVMEKLIHRQLGYQRVRGEWFNVPLEDLKGEVDFAFIRWGDEPKLNVMYKLKLI